jgi:hypothetical protein
MLEASPILRSIVVYVVDPPPLSTPKTGPLFAFLADRSKMRETLEGLIGPHDPEAVALLVERRPGGPAWEALLDGIRQEQVETLVTHLAPLSSAQRQQLIGMCALSGVQLVTPGNAIGAPQPIRRRPA